MEWFVLFLCIVSFIFVILPAKVIIHFAGVDITLTHLFIHLTLLVLYWLWTPGESDAFKFNWFIQRIMFEYFKPHAIDPHNTLERSKTVKTLFVLHPHGVYAVSLSSFFGFNRSVTHVKIGGSSILFRIPIMKDIMYMVGAVPVKREMMIETLKKQSMCMCPGGLRELVVCQNSPTNFLKRKQFISVVKEAGEDVEIVLITSKGETGLYSVLNLPFLYPIQNFCLRYFLYPFPILAWGNAWCPFWPKRPVSVGGKGLELVFSAPIAVKDKTVDQIFKEVYPD